MDYKEAFSHVGEFGSLTKRVQLWQNFCSDYAVREKAVPLFAASFDANQINRLNVTPYGTDNRLMLTRSRQMNALMVSEVEKVVSDFHSKREEYDGVIYLMFWTLPAQSFTFGTQIDNDIIVPLYIGKSEKYGKAEGVLSANIASMSERDSKFCRWGYNYAYHMGDLSAVVCPGHPDNKKNPKYARWAERLFTNFPTDEPHLKRETWFWIKAWRGKDIGIWKDYGPTSLSFLEYLLIGVCSQPFGGYILNTEGVGRRFKPLSPDEK